jgi:UDP-N-acetylglucosamine 2-epimerase (non-hydrolysing)
MKTLFIFGTRPEAIKMAPIIRRMLDCDGVFDMRICVTGQHRQMLDEVLHIFGIRPDYDLDLMKNNQPLAALTAACISSLDSVIAIEQPDWVIVQGDTTTAMAGALAAHYHHVKVSHVEAGLRTGDKEHPFPEETNRRMIASIADIHFAPSQLAADNLIAEGIDKSSIHIVGNTSIDAMRIALDMTHGLDNSSLAAIPFDAKRLILVTAHRRESFGEPIKNICRAIKTVATCHSSNVHIVYPVHMNPNIAEPVHQLLGGIENITMLEPLDYLSFIHLLNRSHIVLTDSGGLQEETPALGKPVLVLRETTERVEAIHAGTARLVGTNPATIIAQVENLLCNPSAYTSMAKAVNPYGDGYTAEKICRILAECAGSHYQQAACNKQVELGL